MAAGCSQRATRGAHATPLADQGKGIVPPVVKAWHLLPHDRAVLSTQLHRVLGDEEVVPEKAVLLGPCRVLPRELPGVTALSDK